jgi:hypothetical protein
MIPVSPVFLDTEAIEVIHGGAGYRPLQALPSTPGNGDRRITIRYALDEEERQALLNGADLMFSITTFGAALQPVFPWICGRGTYHDADPVVAEIVGVRQEKK